MMKVAQLRQSILQAAVQGKLVPQNIHDEPASELLKRIQAEKKKLIKEGKIKKEKPLPPVTEDEIPYDLPEGWVWCRLGEVCTTNPKNKLDDNLEVSFIPMHLISSEYAGGHSHEIRKWGSIRKGFTHFAERDIVIAKITPCFQNGKSCVMKNLENGFGAGTTELHVLRCINILPEYVLIYAKTPEFLFNGKENMTGTAGQQRVPTDYLRATFFPLPPLAEQQRIVAKVDELMAICDELESAEKKLDALEKHFIEYLPKSILQKAIQGKLVSQNIHDEPASELLKRIQAEKKKLIKEGKIKKEKPLPPITEDEIPYDLPEGWVWCRLGDLGDWGAGATPLRTESRYYKNGTINWLKTGELNNDFVYESQEKITPLALQECSLRVNKIGDILVAMYGATIGKLAIVGAEMTTNQACCGCTPFTGVYNRFLFHLLRANKDVLIGQGEGGAQPNISRIKIRLLPVPLPPLAEQQRIVAKVDELMAICEELKRVPETLKAKEKIILLRKEDSDETLRMAARGEVDQQLSDEHKKAIEDLFNEE